MGCFSDETKKIFEEANQSKLCQEIEDQYQELLNRRVDFIEYGDPSKLSAKARTRKNCELLRQALLHRAERLSVSSGTALSDKNAYSLALLVRGHVEATAVLGYFCYRIRSLAKNDITFDNFQEDAANSVAGGKHDLFAENGAPKNIITMIQNADKFLDSEILEKPQAMLQEGYAWLSEFAHPNFCSHSNAFKLDKETGRMVFRHQSEIQNDDFQHLLYLSISGLLLICLYDEFATRAEQALPSRG
jgi:hypothetical protein